MLSDICMHFPEARAWFDLMDRAFVDHDRGYLPSELVFPPELTETGQDVRLWNMDGAVETVFAANQALFSVLCELGIQPDMVAGHSSGDYSALLAAGCFENATDEQLLRHIRELNTVYEEVAAKCKIPKASLLAVGSADDEILGRVLNELAPDLVIALDNCPQQKVLCGTNEAIDRAARLLGAAGAVVERLPFGRPYHTRLFALFSEPLRAFFDHLDLSPPATEIYSCATAAPYPLASPDFREVAVAQWERPVRFRETIEAMYAAGARVFVEVGPRGNLTGFVENTLRGRQVVAVPANTLQRSGIAQLNHAVGLLAAQGIALRPEYLYARRTPRRVSLRRGEMGKSTVSSGSVKLSLRLPRLKLADHIRSAVAGQRVQTRATSLAEGRATAMDKYFESMEQFLRVEREVMQAALASGHSLPARQETLPLRETALPFVDRIVSLELGSRAVALCDLNLEKHRFLRDHTLGAGVSTFDPDLVGLPVLPLAVSIEMLAEAASLVLRGQICVGVRHVQAHRWVVLESNHLTLRLTAVLAESTNEVRVRADLEDGSSTETAGRGQPLVEATITFASQHAPTAPAGEFTLRAARPSKWRAGEMYGRTGMFHGKAFQMVDRMDRSGEDGAEATLVGGEYSGWISSTPTPEFLTDPMLLDAMGQVIGYWVGDRFQKGLSVFPIKLDRLEVLSGALQPGERALCRARVTHVDEDWLRSDIEVVRQDGTVMVRMHKWEDRRLDLPPRLYAFRISPHEVFLSDEWPQVLVGLPNASTCKACRLRLPRTVLEAHGGLWLRVLAYLVLSRDERREWQRLSPAPVSRRLDWLAGRIAAKDAVRLLLEPQLGLLRLADIEIYVDQRGRPAVRGQWMEPGRGATHVTIAHSGGEALAIATDGRSCAGLGADLEQMSRVGEVVRSAALTEREDRWLAAVEQHARTEWAARFWCAKEAVSKALGCGLTHGGQEIEVCDVDRERGVLSLAIGSSDERRADGRFQRRIEACTTSDGLVVTGVAVV
jgi:malonyl CoA-acyl carrier protein transacylase/phosphopantetheinyl transferase (holo-ACP synthase)